MTQGLYVDDGKVITTHSMLSTFSRCPKKAEYKYRDRLKKRVLTVRDKPLTRGTWLHEILELYYRGEDWKARHRALTAKYNNLMDVEKDALGDLPNEIISIMRSYLWHYGANRDDPYHGWNVLHTELTLECPWPDGEGVYRCRLDMLLEDEHGDLYVGDHKSHARLPGLGFRLRDHASALYIWCARENGYNVKGFIWNYIRTKPPTVPALVDVKRTPRLSTKTIDTDYPTVVRAIRNYGLDPADYADMLAGLRAQRWEPGKVQTSPFFHRAVLEKDDDMIARVVGAEMRTRDRMHEYEFNEITERVADRSCDWCDFRELCEVELFGGNGNLIRRKQFRTGDPLEYYNDIKDSSD